MHKSNFFILMVWKIADFLLSKFLYWQIWQLFPILINCFSIVFDQQRTENFFIFLNFLSGSKKKIAKMIMYLWFCVQNIGDFLIFLRHGCKSHQVS